MFAFKRRVWIPPNFKMEISQNRALHVLDEGFKKLFTYTVFTKEPPSNASNHPQFVHFLRENLN